MKTMASVTAKYSLISGEIDFWGCREPPLFSCYGLKVGSVKAHALRYGRVKSYRWLLLAEDKALMKREELATKVPIHLPDKWLKSPGEGVLIDH